MYINIPINKCTLKALIKFHWWNSVQEQPKHLFRSLRFRNSSEESWLQPESKCICKDKKTCEFEMHEVF